MIRIISRRFCEVAIFLLVITFVSFLFARLAPGDPVLSILRVDDVSVTNEQVEQLREEMGFNEPLLIQYRHWLSDFIGLDFGNSYITNQPVMEMLINGLPATLELTFGALLVMIIIALPLGSLAAVYRGSWIDQLSRGVSLLGGSSPELLAWPYFDRFVCRAVKPFADNGEGQHDLCCPSFCYVGFSDNKCICSSFAV